MRTETGPRIEDLLDQVSDGFVSLDREWRYLHASGNSLRMMNKTRETLVGHTLWEVFPEAAGSIFGSECETVMDGRCARSFEMHYPAHDQWMSVRVFPLRLGVGICYSDISLYKDGMLQLAHAREELGVERRRNAERSTFMATASHEFRAPLSAVLSSLDLLGHYGAPEQEAQRIRHTGRIRSSVHSMMDILNELLSLEQLEEGTLKVAYEPIDLRHFLEEMLEQLQGMRKPGQVFAFEHSGECTVLVDPMITGHVLLNLLSNAIKYSDAEVRIRSTVSADRIRIEVIDRGIGIPQAEQDLLFSRFFRASNARDRKGTGLGLTIARRYAQLLGGDICCASVEGQGTTFIVELPTPLPDRTVR